MASNAALEKCPRCAKSTCSHDERVVANLLKQLGTGVINLDVAYRWVASLRKWPSRCAVIELKRRQEPFLSGQKMALADFTGVLKSVTGFTFEVRCFVMERDGSNFQLSTFLKDVPELGLTLVHVGSDASCVRIIDDWYKQGSLPSKPAASQSEGGYHFATLDACRRQLHKLEPVISKKDPLKMNLICRTCSEELHKPAYAAFGDAHLSKGEWNGTSDISVQTSPEIEGLSQ